MNREYVQSSMITSIGYDPSTSILEIEFKNGGSIWQYFDVPENVYHDMRSDGSIGKYFIANIKGQYTESRVG
jgi:uncharacterized protein YuzE